MYFPVNLNSNHIVCSLLYSGQCTVYTICSVQSSLSLSLLSQVQYSIILQSVFICKSISNYWIIKRFIKKFKEFDLLLFVFSPVLYFTSYVGIINKIGEFPNRLDSIYSPVVTGHLICTLIDLLIDLLIDPLIHILLLTYKWFSASSVILFPYCYSTRCGRYYLVFVLLCYRDHYFLFFCCRDNRGSSSP